MDLISLLVWVLVVVLLFSLAVYVVRQTLPGSVQNIALAVIGIIALLAILNVIVGYYPMPRLVR